MRKNVKHKAKCEDKSYVECRKCDKRTATPKCEFLKRKKKEKIEVAKVEQVEQPIVVAA